MGLFNNFRKKQKNDIFKIIVPLAEEGVRNIENDFRTATNEGKIEIFMFNIFLGWLLLDGREFTTKSEILKEKLIKIFEYSYEQNVKWEVEDLLEVYNERFRAYNFDLKGLKNSNYPKTKQYFPVYTFNSMYYEPLKKYQNLTWADLNNIEHFDNEKDDELIDFTGALVKQIKRMQKALMDYNT